MKTGTCLSSFDLFKPIRQTVEKVLPLLVEAEPQIQLQLSLDCPACRTKPLLTRQLWRIFLKGLIKKKLRKEETVEKNIGKSIYSTLSLY